MINCLIIDDEPLALDLMEDYISQVSFLKLTAKCNSPLQALSCLDEAAVDLLFLDISMPQISGIDFYKALTQKPDLIFTTAHSEYALNGFELNAVDYLVKPISFERFVAAANRAKNYIDYKRNKDLSKPYFFINAAHKILKVFYDDIIYLEGSKDYTKIYLTAHATPLLILHNLKYFQDILPPQQFIRIHRSYIISLNKLNAITKKSVLVSQVSVPVSDNYRSDLFAHLNLQM